MLFLFDIDGTLLRGMPPAHREAICFAARSVYGLNLEPDGLGQTAGMTDSAIIRRAAASAGASTELLRSKLPEFFTRAGEEYERLVPEDLSLCHTPHADETLRWLKSRGAILGLVTGNIERIAWVKLRAARLAEFFTFGAFGDEREERNELPAIALRRARAIYNVPVAEADSFVVGDTPADIACGMAGGMRTVAVATGVVHSLDTLRACGPDFVFEDLSGLYSLPI